MIPRGENCGVSVEAPHCHTRQNAPPRFVVCGSSGGDSIFRICPKYTHHLHSSHIDVAGAGVVPNQSAIHMERSHHAGLDVASLDSTIQNVDCFWCVCVK